MIDTVIVAIIGGLGTIIAGLIAYKKDKKIKKMEIGHKHEKKMQEMSYNHEIELLKFKENLNSNSVEGDEGES